MIYKVEVKEVENPTILHPSMLCEKKTKEEVVKFFGLDEPDVEWYKVYEISDDGKEVEL